MLRPTAEGAHFLNQASNASGGREWMKANGEAIYGTTASPFAKQLEFGRATSKPGRIYLHVFNWPTDGSLRVPAWGQRCETRIFTC